MGLFATLASSAGQESAEGGGSSSSDDARPSSSGPSNLPTAVQLHTSRCVDFLSGTVDGRGGNSPGSGGSRRKFEVLTYQAVEVLDSSSTSPGDGSGGDQLVRLPGTLQRTKHARKHLRPNLGVWDCRLPEGPAAAPGTKDAELVDRLLADVIPTGDGADTGADAAAPAVLFAVDLSDPASVYPAVDAMRTALLRRYESAGPPKAAITSPGATTRLSKLRGAKFGSAPQSKDHGADGTAAASATGPDGKIALVVCCAVPPPPPKGSPAQTFQSKQAQSLVLYHLHRFASDVDCTLAFVRADGDSDDANAAAEGDAATNAAAEVAVPSVMVSELAAVVRRVGAGLSPVGGADAEGESGAVAGTDEPSEGAGGGAGADDPTEAGGAPASTAAVQQPPIYPPGSHDDDLIGSVLLRNASCPGVWDAATDDLWKALPSKAAASEDDEKTKTSKGTSPAGDEPWLSKLAESVASLGGAGANDAASVKSGKGKDAAKAGKKKKVPPAGGASAEAKTDDPTSFFENLLKK